MSTIERTRCDCGNHAEPGEIQCDHCSWVSDQPAHVGHYSRLGGGWWCDTCDSPYCDLA